MQIGIEPKLRKRVTDTLMRARDSGRDPVEFLNECGLLATPQWAARIRADMVNDVRRELSKLTVADIVGPKFHSGNYSTSDVLRGVLDRLAETEKQARKGV